MRKTTLLLFAVFSFATAFSQVGIQPGIRAGLNSARLTNADGDRLTDLYIGGFVAFKFTKRYTLQPEINYSRQGGQIELDYLNGDYDPTIGGYGHLYQDVEVQYIGLNVTNKFYIAKGFHLLAGPFIDVKVGGRSDLIDFDMGVYGGLGYTFPIGLTVELRVKQGLVDVFGDNYSGYDDDYNDDYNDDIDHIRLNQLFQLGASYSFDFKK
jgi:hypothetical protein